MKKKATLILFTGLPSTGKTSLSKKIARELALPLLAKDAIKEIMFDELGWSNKAWSAKLARATFKIMDYVTEQQLRAGHTLILEANFMPKLMNKKFQDWQSAYDYHAVQIVCRTEVSVLARRCFERSLLDRHPGHLDTNTIENYQQEFVRRVENGEDQPLAIKGNIIIVDTTNFDAVDIAGLANEVKQGLIAT